MNGYTDNSTDPNTSQGDIEMKNQHVRALSILDSLVVRITRTTDFNVYKGDFNQEMVTAYPDISTSMLSWHFIIAKVALQQARRPKSGRPARLLAA